MNFDSPCFLLSDPKVNWFSFFCLIGSNGSVRLEIMLLPFASFPLHDTPKLAGAVIYSLTHWTHWSIFLGSGIVDVAHDMIDDWFVKLKKVVFMSEVLASTTEIPKFSQATFWHAMDAHIPYHSWWVLSFPHAHNGDALVGRKSVGRSAQGHSSVVLLLSL